MVTTIADQTAIGVPQGRLVHTDDIVEPAVPQPIEKDTYSRLIQD